MTTSDEDSGRNLRAPLDEPNVVAVPVQRISRTKILDGLINEYEAAA
jgi:hypothetical protein